MLKPFFRLDDDGNEIIDVLCITHGDHDHCSGFEEFKEKIDSEDLTIGLIWHQGYDRREHENVEDLDDDYIALEEEIDRRKAISNPSFGSYQEELRAGVEPSIHDDIEFPSDFEIRVLNPSSEDVDDAEFSINDLSCVVNINMKNLDWMLFSGDTESNVWQNTILPNYLGDDEDLAVAKYLVASHHGSYTFFGSDRDTVREADPHPENYEALDKIEPQNLILSTKDRFPVSGDESGDDPPHYAAWKWYHKWFQDNRDVGEDDKHPESFLYTADGHIKLDLNDECWEIDRDYDLSNETKQRNIGKKVGAAIISGNTIKIKGSTTKPVGAHGMDEEI